MNREVGQKELILLQKVLINMINIIKLLMLSVYAEKCIQTALVEKATEVLL